MSEKSVPVPSQSESAAPSAAPAPVVESPPPAPQPARDPLPDPRLKLQKLARELMRTRSRRLLAEYLHARRAVT